MTDVKHLLDAATPLPWSVGKSVHHDGHNLYQPDSQGDITSPDAHMALPDAELAVHAVNRLPDYEVAVDALEYFVKAFEGTAHGTAPHNPVPDSGVCGGCTVLQEDAYDTARAALRRLRGES